MDNLLFTEEYNKLEEYLQNIQDEMDKFYYSFVETNNESDDKFKYVNGIYKSNEKKLIIDNTSQSSPIVTTAPTETLCKFPTNQISTKSTCTSLLINLNKQSNEQNCNTLQKTTLYRSSSEGYSSLDLNSENLSLSSTENVSSLIKPSKATPACISIYDNLNSYMNSANNNTISFPSSVSSSSAHDSAQKSTEHIYDILDDEDTSNFPFNDKLYSLNENEIYSNLSNVPEMHESIKLMELFKNLSIAFDEPLNNQHSQFLSTASSSSSLNSLANEKFLIMDFSNDNKKRRRRRHKLSIKQQQQQLERNDTDSDSDMENFKNNMRYPRNKRNLQHRKRMLEITGNTTAPTTTVLRSISCSKYPQKYFLNDSKSLSPRRHFPLRFP